MNKLKNTKKSAAFDRSSLIINLFREFPNNKFSLKHLASASGGSKVRPAGDLPNEIGRAHV